MRKMFDLNRDGKMSTFERVAEAAFIQSLFVEEQENENYGGFCVDEVEEEKACELIEEEDEEIEENYDADFWRDEEDEVMDELECAGVDMLLWQFMDEDERREAIEDAGLDPDDYEEYVQA